jgi:predicted 3-demethylubiquinone-9 3-methyltransferase (glyoxalase superfamily)
VTPSVLPDLITDPDPAKAERAFAAIMQMKKLDISALQRAHSGA